MFQVLIGALFAILGVWDIAAARSWWSRPPEAMPAYVPLPERMWDDFQRSRLTITLMSLAFGLGGICSAVWKRSSDGPTSAMWVVLAVVVCFLALDLSVVLFNRPSALVPPALRSMPGRWSAGRKTL